MRGFDVGIIPHIRNRLTQKMNPLKLYNYFAAGLPIVTTDINNMTDVVDQIHVAQSAEDFVKALEVSSGESIDINSTQWRDAMQTIAWDTRVSDIIDLLESHFNAEQLGHGERVGVAC